jgi:hypothetical protein
MQKMTIQSLVIASVTIVLASTAQSTPHVPATTTFENAEYWIIATVGKFPSPSDFGIDSIAELTGLSESTAGHVLDFLIDADRLFLDGLYVLSLSDEYPPINGKQAEVKCWEANGMAGCNPGKYSNLTLGIEFDGRLRIARDFIKSCYDHLLPEPQMFRDVKDLTFEKGLLVKVIDRSDEALAMQRQFKDPSGCRTGLKNAMSPL